MIKYIVFQVVAIPKTLGPVLPRDGNNKISTLCLFHLDQVIVYTILMKVYICLRNQTAALVTKLRFLQ